MATNGTMMQYFYWDYPADGMLWNELTRNAAALAAAGVTALWLPPPCKAERGIQDVGYGIYDLFDLGEFDQKGAVRTKYGTRQELEAAIQAAHAAGLQVYLDVVVNHKAGADRTEVVMGTPVSHDNRNIEIGPPREIETWTYFNFPGRAGRYSDFVWDSRHFDAVDYDQRTRSVGTIYKLRDKQFDTPVDPERGNFDYLLFADLDMGSDEVRAELNRWGDWIVQTLGIDGFRFDAAKHIRFFFFNEWLDHVRATAGRDLFAVGEYWTPDSGTLGWLIEQTGRRMSVFDFRLHFNLRDASRGGGSFDMTRVFDGTQVRQDPALAVTFVDNHDSYREDAVQDWFKPLAYALILLREGGQPCVFYPDYYGSPGRTSHRQILDPLLQVRRDHAYGPQSDYFDHPDVVGWTRLGDADHPRALAVVLSDGPGGSKRMNVNRPNRTFADATGNDGGTITSGNDGWGEFRCNGGSVSVWVEE
jgi:alpha-amylase